MGDSFLFLKIANQLTEAAASRCIPSEAGCVVDEHCCLSGLPGDAAEVVVAAMAMLETRAALMEDVAADTELLSKTLISQGLLVDEL